MITKEGILGVYNNLQHNLGTAVVIATCFFIWLAFIVCFKILNKSLLDELIRICKLGARKAGKLTNRGEISYHRDLDIGRLHTKHIKVKAYRLINDLIIDLGLKRKGATPSSFVFMFAVLSALLSLTLAKILFNNLILGIVIMPATFLFTVAAAYTRANIKHDMRIEGVIESENIIANAVKTGVVTAVKNNIDVFPTVVRDDFRDFIDNIDQKNYHIKTALLELNMNLGSIADDFINKCVVFELEETRGMADMFQDIVAQNNEKMMSRAEMKREFDKVVFEFALTGVCIVLFLAGVMFFYPVVFHWYVTTLLGQILLAGDVLLIMVEFVYITYLRAKEL